MDTISKKEELERMRKLNVYTTVKRKTKKKKIVILNHPSGYSNMKRTSIEDKVLCKKKSQLMKPNIEVPYVGSLLCLAINTRPDILFYCK